MSAIIFLYRILHKLFQHFPLFPAWHKWNVTWLPTPLQRIFATIGLLPLIVHRSLLENDNLLGTPPHVDPKGRKPPPEGGCPFRPDDGYGTDVNNPTASMEGAPIGRNMPAVPKHLRNHRGAPDVQLVAQRLLAREDFVPAGEQLNITAAAWIQAMVHDWIQHEDGAKTSLENEKLGPECPLKKFNFFETKERSDGHFNSKRTQWWDASFVYGQNSEQVKASRAGEGGKMRIDEKSPDVLPSRSDGTDYTGDNSNSWVGVTVLQLLFLKEHNYCAEKIAEQNPGLTDDEIFGYARNIISALTAKIHTVDWTCELLKTEQLRIGMETNWRGIAKAVIGNFDFLPRWLCLIQKPDGSDIKGTPFCLTEEFAAVYRLHPLLPPGLIIENEGSKPDEFLDLKDCLTAKGRDQMRKPGMSKKIMHSIFHYPCGHLVASNYPDAMRNVAPTDTKGIDIPDSIDLAAIDLFRDRERGIQNYNDFRRKLKLKPWKTWEEMTGEDTKTNSGGFTKAQKLEAIYGPAPQGIEKCDLLVGDLYEKKIEGFAISETSFMIFLLMASRRLDADPYLNEYFDAAHYTPFGMDHMEEVSSLKDILKRHYPDIADAFPEGYSAFKPIYPKEKWEEKKELFPELSKKWADTKEANDTFFKKEIEKTRSTVSLSTMNKAIILILEFVLLALFHAIWGVGNCNLHDITPVRLVATAIYILLIFWGLHIGNTVALNTQISKDQLANPSLSRKLPGFIFIIHFLICVLHSLVLGPLFLVRGLRRWYWTSFVAMLFGSLPLVPFNYNPESFGKAVGRFVTLRNVFELSLSLYLATILGDDDESFRTLSVYHYWIWGYRLLDVGPRRLMKSMLIPSIQMLLVLIAIYIAAIVALRKDFILFAGAPHCGSFGEEEAWQMQAGRILYCFAVYMIFYLLQRQYVKEVAETDGFKVRPMPPGGTHDENVKNKKKAD